MKSQVMLALLAGLLAAMPVCAGEPVIHQGPDGGDNPALAKIDRTIVKEPKYKEAPKYAVLTFGPEAKFRVWLVIDGDTLYADLNGNGDLTEKGEAFGREKNDNYKVFEVGDITDPNTKLKHAKLHMTLLKDDAYQVFLDAAFDNPKVPVLHGMATPSFAAKPADAPVVHFGGPLSMRPSFATHGGKPAFVVANVGTPGVGEGSFVNYTKSVFRTIDKKLRPIVEIEYVNAKGETARERCRFRREEIEHVWLYPVIPGKKEDRRECKITLWFPDWLDAGVEQSSVSRPIVVLAD